MKREKKEHLTTESIVRNLRQNIAVTEICHEGLSKFSNRIQLCGPDIAHAVRNGGPGSISGSPYGIYGNGAGFSPNSLLRFSATNHHCTETNIHLSTLAEAYDRSDQPARHHSFSSILKLRLRPGKLSWLRTKLTESATVKMSYKFSFVYTDVFQENPNWT
jgi:hypothetical protein